MSLTNIWLLGLFIVLGGRVLSLLRFGFFPAFGLSILCFVVASCSSSRPQKKGAKTLEKHVEELKKFKESSIMYMRDACRGSSKDVEACADAKFRVAYAHQEEYFLTDAIYKRCHRGQSIIKCKSSPKDSGQDLEKALESARYFRDLISGYHNYSRADEVISVFAYMQWVAASSMSEPEATSARAEARQAWAKLVKEFPKSPKAVTAKAFLKAIDEIGASGEQREDDVVDHKIKPSNNVVTIAGREWQVEGLSENIDLYRAGRYCRELYLDGEGWTLPSEESIASFGSYLQSFPGIGRDLGESIARIQIGKYWVAPSNSGYSADAPTFNMVNSVLTWDFTEKALVRCVRLPKGLRGTVGAVESFVSGDLSWQAGVTTKSAVSWHTALEYCRSLGDGTQEWRLPSLDELTALHSNRTELLESDVAPLVLSGVYWSADRQRRDMTQVFDFTNGEEGSRSENAEAKVRCVSALPSGSG